MSRRNKLFHYIAEKFLDKELTDQDVCIVSVSLKEVQIFSKIYGPKENFGKIIFVNDIFKQTFGHKEDTLNSNIMIIIPDFIAPFHDWYLRRYISSNQDQLMNRMVKLYAKHKEEHIIPVHLTFKMSPLVD